MDERTKVIIAQRLASASGHLSSVERMARDDTPCIDVIRQIQAVQAALNKVSVMMLEAHLHDCILSAVHSDDHAERARVLSEVVSIFAMSKKHNNLVEGDFKTVETKTFTVPNISCGGCTNTIELNVGNMAGVTSVETDQRTQRVTVAWEAPATWAKIQSLLQAINYPPEGLIQLN